MTTTTCHSLRAMRSSRAVMAVLVPSLLLGAGVAQAFSTMQIPGCVVPLGLVPQVCGGAEGSGSAEGIGFTASPLPNQFFVGDSGSMGVAGGGNDGITAGAGGSGTYGEIHLTAVADNGSLSTPGPRTGQAVATSEIRFLDGAVVSAPGGGFVDVRVTISMDGVFSGDGEADSHIAISENLEPLLNTSPFIWGPNPSFSLSRDLLITSGDTVYFQMQIIAQASTANDSFGALGHSSADVSHTGRMYFDVITPGGTFSSLSGHDYATPVPGPGAFWLLSSALAGLGLQRRRHTGP